MKDNFDAPPQLSTPLHRLRFEGKEKGALFLDDTETHLSPKEALLFNALLQGRGGIVRHEDLLSAVFPDEPPPKGNIPKALASAIQQLGIKLGRLRGKDGEVLYIESQRGVGYRLAYKKGT